jgi:3-oxoacyl-[acyl-carrier protein] reductase
MSAQLAGRRVVITGSTRGLGLAFARHALAQGACVVVNGRTASACEQAVAVLGHDSSRLTAVAGSVTDPTTAERLVDAACRVFGGLDGVVNNAGITRDRSLARMQPEDFDAVLDTHAGGTWNLCRAAASRFSGPDASIVNVVSGSALYGLYGQSNYAAAKGACLALTRALSYELAPRGVRVNALYPIAATDMTAGVQAMDESFGAMFADPDEVAPVCSYLLSDAAEGVTGQLVSFDGRELCLWSHPQITQRASRNTWTDKQFDVLFAERFNLEPMHPDLIGQMARSATRPKEHM